MRARLPWLTSSQGEPVRIAFEGNALPYNPVTSSSRRHKTPLYPFSLATDLRILSDATRRGPHPRARHQNASGRPQAARGLTVQAGSRVAFARSMPVIVGLRMSQRSLGKHQFRHGSIT